MKTLPFHTAPLSDLHVDVTSTVDGAREHGPLVLLDTDGTPQGIVLAFGHPQEAQEWQKLGAKGRLAHLARLLAETAAGRGSAA